MDKDVRDVNMVLKKVIGEINDGKDKIFKISESLRDEFEREKQELEMVIIEIGNVINEVDRLEKLDKKMRLRLAKESMNLKNNDAMIQKTYEDALEVRVKFITMQKEEKELRKKRDKLELSLKNYLKNIEEADSVIKQVNVALHYLSGDVEDGLGNIEGNSKMNTGIKILEAQEQERSRIAREVHDGPAQYLASTIMRIDFCKTLLNDDLVKGLKELDDLKGDVKKALKEVRGIIFDLRPPFLERLTLTEAVQDLVDTFLEESNIDLDVSFQSSARESEHIIEVGVYRIIQELLNNIKKHSKAREGNIKLEIGREWIYIVIEDDGIGFNLNEVIEKSRKSNSSYGILGIFERVNQLGGDIKVDAVKDLGTGYKIKLPTSRRKKCDD
ncbi:histidine kinase [Clostridium paraputrificum]|uniref:sensor histidine kinase n=1 Tax=Clostridium paraputrificum TaxID=29363 RepID=UPI003D32DF15